MRSISVLSGTGARYDGALGARQVCVVWHGVCVDSAQSKLNLRQAEQHFSLSLYNPLHSGVSLAGHSTSVVAHRTNISLLQLHHTETAMLQ